MPKFRDKQDLLYLSHFDDNIEDEEFMRTGEIKKNQDLLYWIYKCFDLEKLSHDECLEEFCVMRNDIYKLREVFIFLISLCVTTVLQVDSMI